MKFSHIGIAAAALLWGGSMASCSQSPPSGVCDGVTGACLDLYVTYSAPLEKGYELEIAAIYDGKSSKRISSGLGIVTLPNHFRVVPPPGIADSSVTGISFRAKKSGNLLATAKVTEPFLRNPVHNQLSVNLQPYLGKVFDDKSANYTVCKGPRSTRITDLDLDGHNDIIVTCYNEESIAILYGTANSQFTTFQQNQARMGKFAYFSAIMDVDQNGTLDIVTPSYEDGTMGTNGWLSVLKSAPNRGWSGPAFIASSEARLLDAVAADFTGDGMMDFIVNTNGSASKLLIFPNNSFANAGQPVSKIDLPLNGSYSLAAGFLDADSNADVVTVGNVSNSFSVVWGNNLQTSPTVSTYTPIPGIVQSLTPLIADVDGDNKNDIIIVQCGNPSVVIYKNMGNRKFQETNRFDTGKGSCTAVADDFDRDGRIDLVVRNDDDFTVSVLLGIGNGEFKLTQTIVNNDIAYIGHIASGDLNNDGMPDIVLSGSASNDPFAVGRTVSVHYNQVP